MPPALEMLLTALPAQVTLDKTPDGKTSLRGLPVLRVGTWNGRSYTEADLQALASNFTEIRDGDQWQPPMRPRHLLDPDGRAVSIDAREVLGWHQALRYDPASKLLLADLEVVDADTVTALESGKLRYVSAEVFRSGYQSPVTGKTYETPVYYGAAFVDNPAVKGMPWQVVVNAAEYGHSLAEPKDGDTQMTWLEMLKSMLREKGVADEELAAVDQLAAKPTADTKDGDKPPAAVDESTRAQVEQLLLTVKEQQTALEQLRTTRAQEAAEATVDKYVTTGLVPPAVRLQCLHLVQTLGTAAPIELLALDAEGKQTTRKASALELLGEILEACKPELATRPQGRLWQGEAGKPAEQLSAEEIEKAADALLAAGK